MKVKFSKFERVAGFFVLSSVIGFSVSLVTIAVKQGWFESKVYYRAQFDNGEGVHPGLHVQISGLNAGIVEEVELNSENKINVRFFVFSKFADKIRQDSITTLLRPYVIGERVLEVTVGSQTAEKLAANAYVPSQESIDLITVMSGRKFGNYMATMSDMLANLKYLAEAFLDKERTKNIVDMFDRIDPLLRNLNSMSVEVVKLSKQMNKDDRMGVVMGELAITTKQINSIIPDFKDKAPQLAKDLSSLVKNLSLLTEDFKVVMPALATIAPELPRVSKRAVEALDEAVVLMKALQRSFIVRGSVDEVREEEAKKSRNPAGK